MAVLDNDDFTEIKNQIRGSTHRDTFRSWGLDKPTWKLLFQAAEDWNINGFTVTPTTSFKAALEVEGGAMTNAQAKAVAKIWSQWSFKEA